MNGFCAAPVAELLKFDLPFHLLSILMGVIIPPFADDALQSYEIISPFRFCHTEYSIISGLKNQMRLPVLLRIKLRRALLRVENKIPPRTAEFCFLF
jgi:hypothetical protein